MNYNVALHRRRMSKIAKTMTPEEAVRRVNKSDRLNKNMLAASEDYAKKLEGYKERLARGGMSEEKIQQTLQKSFPSEAAASEKALKASTQYDKGINTAKTLAANPNLAREFIGKSKEQVQEMLKARNLSAAELANIQAHQLTFGQNMKALGHELKGQSYTPKAIAKRGWENMGEGGGGWKGGTGWGRYNVLGAKGMTGIFAAGDLKDAANKTDATGQGRSRTERLAYAAGGAGGSVLGAIGAKRVARIGGLKGTIVAGLAGLGGMIGGYHLGGKAGKVVDKGLSNIRGVAAGDYKQQLLADAQKAYEARKNRGY